MTLEFGDYKELNNLWPQSGQHIIGFYDENSIVVYQAYNHQIADYAMEHQTFGGSHYSFSRMSWIKPNFLWMMYRCGWATKENQERVLAIWISRDFFEKILSDAVYSSFNALVYRDHEHWKEELKSKEVRLQWDPDHDPFGDKQARRAIQLGMKGQMLEKFCREQIRKIEDLTPFVKEQMINVDKQRIGKLLVPKEKIFNIGDENLRRKLGIGGDL
jgi:hypothetical protein